MKYTVKNIRKARHYIIGVKPGRGKRIEFSVISPGFSSESVVTQAMRTLADYLWKQIDDEDTLEIESVIFTQIGGPRLRKLLDERSINFREVK